MVVEDDVVIVKCKYLKLSKKWNTGSFILLYQLITGSRMNMRREDETQEDGFQ